MSGVARILGENLNHFSVPFPSIDNKGLGERLRSVTAEQIQTIAAALCVTLKESMDFAHNPTITHWLTYRHGIERDAKSLFLEHLPFESDLREDFASGESSFLTLGHPLEYSYEAILRRSVYEDSVRATIGKELAAKNQYLISFCLDLESMKSCCRLCFFIIEKQGVEVLDRKFYSV